MKILVEWILKALTLLVVAQLVPGFKIDSFTTALVVSLVLGILNLLIKPILVFLTLPINILTLGLFTFVINAVLLLLAARLVSGFEIKSFLTAVVASIVLTIVSTILHALFG